MAWILKADNSLLLKFLLEKVKYTFPRVAKEFTLPNRVMKSPTLFANEEKKSEVTYFFVQKNLKALQLLSTNFVYSSIFHINQRNDDEVEFFSTTFLLYQNIINERKKKAFAVKKFHKFEILKECVQKDCVNVDCVIIPDVHGCVLTLLLPLIEAGIVQMSQEGPVCVYITIYDLIKGNICWKRSYKQPEKDEVYIKIPNVSPICKKLHEKKVIFLGDYIDRGEESEECIFILIDLLYQISEMNDSKAMKNFICLLGNHELNLFQSAEFFKSEIFVMLIIREHIQCLVDKQWMKCIHREGNIVFTHAGINLEFLMKLMLSLRLFESKDVIVELKRIIKKCQKKIFLHTSEISFLVDVIEKHFKRTFKFPINSIFNPVFPLYHTEKGIFWMRVNSIEDDEIIHYSFIQIAGHEDCTRFNNFVTVDVKGSHGFSKFTKTCAPVYFTVKNTKEPFTKLLLLEYDCDMSHIIIDRAELLDLEDTDENDIIEFLKKTMDGEIDVPECYKY